MIVEEFDPLNEYPKFKFKFIDTSLQKRGSGVQFES